LVIRRGPLLQDLYPPLSFASIEADHICVYARNPENGQAKVLREEIPALAIVPAILRNFNLSVPHYMGNTGPYPY
jgi:hypothetical protein